jgi:hypothetical protein
MYEHVKHPPKDGTYTVNLFSDNFRGMEALLNWLEGYRSAGKGEVPGHFELIMHLRSLDIKSE